MQISCYKCQMPIAMSNEVIFAALDIVHDEKLNRYDIRCPKCRKTNRVSKKQLRQMAPTWRRDREETLPDAE